MTRLPHARRSPSLSWPVSALERWLAVVASSSWDPVGERKVYCLYEGLAHEEQFCIVRNEAAVFIVGFTARAVV